MSDPVLFIVVYVAVLVVLLIALGIAIGRGADDECLPFVIPVIVAWPIALPFVAVLIPAWLMYELGKWIGKKTA